MDDVIRCPKCEGYSSISRGGSEYKTFDNGVKRRTRVCRDCGNRWRTYEVPEAVWLYAQEQAEYHREARTRDLSVVLRVLRPYVPRDGRVKRAAVMLMTKAQKDGLDV